MGKLKRKEEGRGKRNFLRRKLPIILAQSTPSQKSFISPSTM
jgi:hypothetical protein